MSKIVFKKSILAKDAFSIITCPIQVPSTSPQSGHEPISKLLKRKPILIFIMSLYVGIQTFENLRKRASLIIDNQIGSFCFVCSGPP